MKHLKNLKPVRIWFGNNPRPNWDLICKTIIGNNIESILESISLCKNNKIFLCLDVTEQEEIQLMKILFKEKIFIFKIIVCNLNHKKVYSYLQQNGYRVEYLPVTSLTKGCGLNDFCDSCLRD